MTLKEQGYDVEFVNWRGFFAAPGLPEATANAYRAAIAKMYGTLTAQQLGQRAPSLQGHCAVWPR